MWKKGQHVWCTNVSNCLFKTVDRRIKPTDLNTCLKKEDADAYGKLYQLQRENLNFSATKVEFDIFFWCPITHFTLLWSPYVMLDFKQTLILCNQSVVITRIIWQQMKHEGRVSNKFNRFLGFYELSENISNMQLENIVLQLLL